MHKLLLLCPDVGITKDGEGAGVMDQGKLGQRDVCRLRERSAG